jgi:acetylornithine deacetylase/succinyl-diaminopimelate desuccinylase-like protein
MSSSIEASDPVIAFARSARQRFISELCEFLRFPSVSSNPRHARDVRNCAAWLAAHLRNIGLTNAGLLETGGAPIIYAESFPPGSRYPTVLIYGHYDVQPPEPLDAWRSPPFDPVLCNGNLRARGASDDKGQLFTHVKALECFIRTVGAIPVGVRCLFEGEEEIGSPHFRASLEKHKKWLRSDVAVISDTQMRGAGRPAITYALRGSLNLEIDVFGPARDVHSGTFGGAAPNPIHALGSIISALHDRDGRIAVPGFYSRALAGPPEPGESAYQRTTLRPALIVSGISGGHQGPGVKSIIPHSATAKINIRLVPDQNPAEIDALVRRHLARASPRNVVTRVRTVSATPPVVIPRRHPFMRAASRAYAKAFGRAPVLTRSGGSIPVVNMFREVLGIPTVLMGFGLPDDGPHGPNEKTHLPTFFRGIETSIYWLREVAAARASAEAA